MTATVLDGTATAGDVRADLKQRVAALAERGVTPGLGTVLVGDDPGSRTYVAAKHRDCAEIGIAGTRCDLPASATQADVESAVDQLNADPDCDGFLVQLPLPPGLDAGSILERVRPEKDADGLHPINLGRLAMGRPGPIPCTPRGIVELLRRYDVPVAGAHAVILGRGVTVGRPLALLLTSRGEDATVTLCHTKTRDETEHLRLADIVIAAAGVPGMITPEMVRAEAAVVDVGITRTEGGLVGDVDRSVRERVRWHAPVPGGVGPMTRAMLLRNIVEAAERRQR